MQALKRDHLLSIASLDKQYQCHQNHHYQQQHVPAVDKVIVIKYNFE